MRRALLFSAILFSFFDAASVRAVDYTGDLARDPFFSPNKGSVSGEDLFKLNGVVWGVGAPKAIIDGKVVGIGGRIHGAEVLEITKDGVKINYNGKEIYLRQQKGK